MPAFIFLFLLAGLLLAGCQQQSSNLKNEAATSNGNEIKIGAISSLTGNASTYGDPAGKAIALAAEQINNNGGILGRQVKIILEDGMCDAKTTADAVNKLVNVDKVKVILGGHCSTESLTIAPVANANKVIQLASITSSDDYTNAGDFSFRNWPSSNYYVSKLGDIAYQKGARNIAILYEQKDFPVSTMVAFKNRFTQLGGRVASEQSFLTTETDFRNYLTKIKNENGIDSIFFAVQGDSNASLYFKTLKELGMLDKYLLFTNNDPVTKKIYDDTQGLNKNVFTTDAYADSAQPKTNAFLEAYKAKYGEYPTSSTFQAASSYDGLFVIRDAIEHCQDVNTECIRDYLYGLKDWQGAGGSLSIDENGDAMTTIGLHYFDNDGNEVWQAIEN